MRTPPSFVSQTQFNFKRLIFRRLIKKAKGERPDPRYIYIYTTTKTFKLWNSVYWNVGWDHSDSILDIVNRTA